jgi:hypothetical protein
MMIATFWFGVAITAWGWALQLGHQYHSALLPEDYFAYEVFALAALGWSSMFSAVWALLGRAKKGLVIGIGMWVLLLIVSLFWLTPGI